MKKCMENFLIILYIMYLCVHVSYNLTLSEPSGLQNLLYVCSWDMVLVKKDIDITT